MDDYDIDPIDIQSPIAIAHYWPQAVRGHIMRILRTYFGNSIDQNRERKKLSPREPSVPAIHCMEVKRSEVFSLPLLDLDESTVEGNAAILEEVVEKHLGVDLEALIGRSVPVAGDQMTTSRQRTAKWLRVRDLPKHQLKWVLPFNGFLHIAFAMCDGVKRAHFGRADGRDQTSLSHFSQLLGRTKVHGTNANFNASHRFLMCVLDAHVIAAAMAVARVENEGDFKEWLKSNDYVQLVDNLVACFLEMTIVESWRSDARRKAEAIASRKESEPLSTEKQRKAEYSKIVDKESKKRRDVVLENAVLFLQHSLMYLDFWTAMRAGDSGRLEMAMDMMTVFFQGVDKCNYAREMLEQKIDRLVVWTPQMRKVWLNNCLVNLSGAPNKFLGLDELMELCIQMIKVHYSEGGNWKLKDFKTEVISICLILFRDMARGVYRASGAPILGTRHSRVQQAKDVQILVRELVDEGAFYFSEGHCTGGSSNNPVTVRESIDAMTVGRDKLAWGGPIAEVVNHRLGRDETVGEETVGGESLDENMDWGTLDWMDSADPEADI